MMNPASTVASFATHPAGGNPTGESHPAARPAVSLQNGRSAERPPGAAVRPCDYGPKVDSDGTFGREVERVALPPEQEGPVNSRYTKGYVIIGWARRRRAFSG
jgi:hypothetical protein